MDSDRSDLTDIVDYPRETLEIELKEWVDLTDRVVQAKLAKHLAALANHGGGYVLFGFCDDMSIAPSRPAELSHFNRDTFSSIIKRYLNPTFQCEVIMVTASGGLVYPIIRVPSHGSTPVAAKADGPSDSKGQPQGVKSGTYYIRKPGPESAPIQGAEEWHPLIRRCVIADRDGLLADIARVVQPSSEPVAVAAERLLQTWHADSDKRWRAIVAKATALQWPVDIESNHCQLSYMILSDDGALIPSSELKGVLERVNLDVHQTVWTGWSMFYPFTRPEIAAALHPEHEDGRGVDVLESNLIGDGDFDISLPDYWRYAADGRATIIRPYREDRKSTVEGKGRVAGTWLSPETVIRETAELVTHARHMAERFDGGRVLFQCSWRGLAGREIDDFGSIYWSPGRVAHADQRTTTGSWEVSMLAANSNAVIANLSCPVLSLFGFNDCSAELVQRLAPRFIKL